MTSMCRLNSHTHCSCSRCHHRTEHQWAASTHIDHQGSTCTRQHFHGTSRQARRMPVSRLPIRSRLLAGLERHSRHQCMFAWGQRAGQGKFFAIAICIQHTRSCLTCSRCDCRMEQHQAASTHIDRRCNTCTQQHCHGTSRQARRMPVSRLPIRSRLLAWLDGHSRQFHRPGLPGLLACDCRSLPGCKPALWTHS